ncbi:hypothetical protein NOS3756_00640 [Nostoc sp. NIES-3756]|uniref:DUF1822 family protein n=1 Tax=Nostoc sp. NIES-3756 TaxID=1751286 RepID=UPI000721954F|nr:DUF1822 family protein [Nostoc sp. NIES-3756]BAT51142.1 hypothetical protein NOS3756_00640 [Nostoc sp. NIES-3756]BAY41144.1 hypothetical protein NIES2111_55350 [Nostoc sp. NIES-2111]
MTTNPTVFTFADSTDLILEIPSTTLSNLESQFSHPYSRYQAYLNELCLNAVLPWLQEDFSLQAKLWPSSASLASFWELVNGTAVIVDATRFILVPSENIDHSELRVPQEWVDLPTWAGDYYLAVEVAADAGYVKVWGYCTHAQLKNQGKYDAGDRTYCLDEHDIVNDMSVLAVARDLCPDEVTQAAIIPVPTLPQEQAQNLITRLSNPEIINPRLAIPFQLWGGLIEHGGWRQSLYERRLRLPEQRSALQWLRTGVSQIAEAVGWERLNLQLSAASARSVEGRQPKIILSRRLTIAGQLYELLITPQGEPDTPFWRFELRNATVGAAIPGGFKLRLLTEDLQPFPNNEDIATTAVEQLYVEVALEAGEGIVWEIEPLPENYDREIIKF